MSAVIWCGIVAVWIFVLIPTWVRRGDIHWHRGTAVTAVMTQGSPSRAPSGSRRKVSIPGVKRLRRRSRSDSSIEVEAMVEQEAHPSRTVPASASASASNGPERVAAAVAPRARVAAAPSSGRLGSAVRASMGAGRKTPRKKPPLRVRRARRLVAIAAIALATLIAAIVAGVAFIVVNLIADVALVLYVRHLRMVAREQQARIAREKRARAARQAWDVASAQERASEIAGWRSAVPEPETKPYEAAHADAAYQESGETEYQAEYQTEYQAGYEAAEAVVEAPDQIDFTQLEQPPLIDLTDAPTEELVAAKAS